MVRYSVLCLIAVLAAGCGKSVTDASFDKGALSEKVIVGYGYGDIRKASKGAWEDAREKLYISGLDDYYGLAETTTTFRNGTAAIVFTLVPLNELDPAVPDPVNVE